MTEIRYALFPTSLGACALAWGPRGLVGAHLPQSNQEASRARLQSRFPGAVEAEPPPEIHAVMDRIRALFEGARDDLQDVALDFERVPELHRRIYALARAIPPGKTRTYGEIAKELGDDPRLARDVGEAMAKNPWPIVVPCHRVTAAGGKLGGFSAPGGARTKRRLLAIEGAEAAGQGDLFG